MAPDHFPKKKSTEKISPGELINRFPNRYAATIARTSAIRKDFGGNKGDELVEDVEKQSTAAVHETPTISNVDVESGAVTVDVDRKSSQEKNSSVVEPNASAAPSAPIHEPKSRLGEYHQKLELAAQHLDVARWRPRYPGILPANDQHYSDCINAVALGLLDTTRARDRLQRPTAFANFGPRGAYNDRDIEITATSLVHQAARLYTHGATSLFFKTPANIPRNEDANLQFKERLAAFIKLIRDFKKAADDVMCGRCIEEFLAAPVASWHALNDLLDAWDPNGTARYMEALTAQGVALDQARMGATNRSRNM
ncbi:uncharacterized protein K460DRAFT_356040 [Cucurbitaria berberidis CBS 394.84]|uniref:Uncharacterized protein n=1 Tax=Cucurbitaria berberidis CBS 394.84 TaxID=1168544 RepID=A0A9P4L8Q6_9PLEO|nr:uncharacterized protein K460DRAFT_356040 [Cucurbitaria berberidis CBS 394.84]KAF1846351.1 hypothetical protein K460DRAFT_356040 [Cucurbitaria berberidis CBS 394.84]